MSIKIGEQIIPQIILGVTNLNKIMLGIIEIFPNLAQPVAVPITIVNTQTPTPLGTPTNTIPLDTAGLQAGDTVFMLTRADTAPLSTVTIPSFPSVVVTQQLFRQNGFTDSLAINSFVVPAGMGDSGTIDLQSTNSVLIHAAFIVARGGSSTGLTELIGSIGATNTGSVALAPTNSSQEAIFIGIGVSTTTNPSTITSFVASEPTAANIGTPRVGVTGLACIMGVPASITVTQAPVASGQMIGGIWMTFVAQVNPPGDWSPLDLPNLLAWYDPSDLGTMFQSANSMEPVTASGQPVGVLLDKSQNLVLGPEMLANNDFDNGWTTFVSSTIVGTTLVVNAGNATVIAQHPVSPTWVLGSVYEITITISEYTSGSVAATDVFAAATPVGVRGVGTHKQYYLCQRSDFPNTRIMSSNFEGFVGTLDSISIKRIEGDPIAITTAGARPQYLFEGGVHWLVGDGVDDLLLGAMTPELTAPWEMWVGARIDVRGGINTGLLSKAQSPGSGSTSPSTQGVNQRSDVVERVQVAQRISGATVDSVEVNSAFSIGSPFVARGEARVGPNELAISSNGGTPATVIANYAGTPGTNGYRLFQAAGGALARISEGVVSGAALSPADATQLQSYMNTKAGIVP
jgi:hypothetical protein